MEDCIIIGAGAAGLFAAGAAVHAGKRVTVLEHMDAPGKKLLITGKGRCNVTNNCGPDEFLKNVRRNPRFLYSALNACPPAFVMELLEKGLGVPLKTERGRRVFPQSDRAQDVLDALLRWAKGARLRYEGARELMLENGRCTGVRLQSGEALRAGAVLVATGGVSYPVTGSTGDGYLLAHRLGHAIVEIRPSLTPLETSLPFAESLKGLRLKNISARLAIDDRYVQQEFGELEFTPFVSGPVTLRMSRQAVDALIDGQRVAVDLDLKPALNPTQLRERIAREAETLGPQAPLSSLLRKLLPAQLIRPFAASLQIPERLPLNAVKATELDKIVGQLKLFRLPISDYRPFEEAIVTAGGVSTAEVDPQTMQSRLVKGLYFAGELLDIDADTGGYNLQIAYSTGHLAGQMLGNK